MKKFTIGKYTLESLTTGMYIEPYVLYREYIQNSADSIDKAISKKIIKIEDGKIQVSIFKDRREIEISDNGVGVSKDKVYNILMDIGNSEKRADRNKGFRGIGRLSGLGYCDKIIFETSAIGENVKSIITFDSTKLQEFLSPGKYQNLTLEDIIRKSSTLEFIEEKDENHFFKVKLIEVNDKLKLLEFDRVLAYLQETAPVPYDIESFKFGEDINKKLVELGMKIDEYNLFLCNEDVSVKINKPHRSKLIVDLKKRILDEITAINIEVIKNDLKDGKLVALVWYGKNNLLGTITEDALKGLRIRKSGLLIGDRFTANSIFKEERFNGWIIGEIIILDKDIIPNARRDNFEKNDDYLFLMKKLSTIGDKISNEIRLASKMRNDIQKNRIIDSNKKDNHISSKSTTMYKELDRLIEEITYRDMFLGRLKDVLIKNQISHEIAEKLIEDLRKQK
jgi:molecular chaperone HtpG